MSYKHLTKSDRYYIAQRKANNPAISLLALGREMHRSHTSLSREIRRNLDQEFGFYSGIRAETLKNNRKNGDALYLNLRHGIKKYRRKLNKENACAVINKKRISERPAIAGKKLEPGHWEMDTILGLDQKSYLLTLTDKATKFEVIRKFQIRRLLQ